MSRNARRQYVVLRPKVRSQRTRQRVAIACVAALGAGAALTLRHMKQELPAWEAVRARLLPSPSLVEITGVPEPLRLEVASFWEARVKAAPPAPAPEELLTRFACLREVRPRRDWLRGRLRLELSLRQAVGRTEGAGLPAGYLSADGVIFTAEAGLYPAPLPVVEPGKADEAELRSAARFLREVADPNSLVSPLSRLRFVSAEQGWEARLADGTSVLWGRLDWTAQKLARLREVLQDGRSQFKGLLAADLRYFEDGKILLKPVKAQSSPLR